MQNTARDSITVRNNPQQEALPMRRLGSFLPGEVVGGSGVHWSGHTWRWTDMEFKIRSNYEERYGKKFIPDDMTIRTGASPMPSSNLTMTSLNIPRQSPARPAISAGRSSPAVIRSKR